MKLELTYIFECPGGFKFVRNTPEEIISVYNENLQAIINHERECKGSIILLSNILDNKNHYLPKGYISILCKGRNIKYELRTEVKQLN